MQGWDESCKRSGKTPGQLLAENVSRCADLIRREDAGKPIYVWSDMFDPFHNAGKSGRYYSLPALEKAGLGKVSRLPVSVRVVLESALRNYDGKKVTETHLKNLAGWKPKGKRSEEVPFVVARVLLQDMTGVPLVVDFAAMREAAKAQGKGDLDSCAVMTVLEAMANTIVQRKP